MGEGSQPDRLQPGRGAHTKATPPQHEVPGCPRQPEGQVHVAETPSHNCGSRI